MLVLLLVLTGCAPDEPTDGGSAALAGSALPSPTVGTAASPPVPSATSPDGPAEHTGHAGGVTQEAAGSYAPPGEARRPPTTEPAAGVDHRDLLSVARGYVQQRLTYRYDDLAGYTAALTAPALTTAAFAARSRPDGAVLARLRTAQETSSVRVRGAELEGEAPNTATTRYVSVACTVQAGYRGDGDGGGRRQEQVWTLRLVQPRPGQWRVDGVLSTQ